VNSLSQSVRIFEKAEKLEASFCIQQQILKDSMDELETLKTAVETQLKQSVKEQYEKLADDLNEQVKLFKA
jgi:predicted phage-related endonuclease